MGSLAALRRGSALTVVLVFGFLSLFLLAVLSILDVLLSGSMGSGAVVVLVLLAALFILLQWALSPWIVRRAARATHPVNEQTNPWLYGVVMDLARQAEVKGPRAIWVNDDPAPNAFVFGRTVASSEMVITKGLLEKLNKDEIRAVVAHEIGHLRHKDVVVMTLVSAVPVMAYIVARVGFEFLTHSRGGSGKGKGQALLIALVIAIVSYLIYLITQMLVLYLSRTREYYADAYSGAATRDPYQLSSALTKISYGLSLAHATSEPSGLRAFMIGDPVRAAGDYEKLEKKMADYDLDHDGQIDNAELAKAAAAERRGHWRRANELFATHPPTYARILMLGQLEEELDKGGVAEDAYKFV